MDAHCTLSSRACALGHKAAYPQWPSTSQPEVRIKFPGLGYMGELVGFAAAAELEWHGHNGDLHEQGAASLAF